MESTIEKIWEDVSNEVRAGGFNPAAFTSWIAPLVPYKIDKECFILLAKNEHIKTTVLSRYTGRIASAIKQALEMDLEVVVKLENEVGADDEDDASKKTLLGAANANLRPRYLFESFVKGKSNEFAYEAAMAVAEEPGMRYNPLFLHGDVGLGKTHLIHSIGNHVLHNRPNAKVLYTSSENLVNEFIGSIRNKKNQEFRDKYRTVDVLLVDDIQFLSDKEGTQEEFFHTFNALHNDYKQIVLTSDKPPKDLKSLEDRLRSRFASGLIADISLPDLETRMAILEKKAEAERVAVNTEVIHFIAKSISSNIRELEGALSTVAARAKLTNSVCSIEFAERTLAEMINQKQKRTINVPYIQEIVGGYYGITPDEIRSRKRTAGITYARHISMYLSRMFIDKTLSDIGKEYGGRDHSTVIHACDKISNEVSENEVMHREVEELVAKIKGE